MADTHAAKVKALSKSFGSLKAVQGLSFSVRYGSVVGFIGPNGAGKTTTLRTIVGHIRPDDGHALVAGRPYRSLTDPLGTVGAVLETGAMHPGRSGRNHLRILARQAGIPMNRVNETRPDRGGSTLPPTAAWAATRWGCASVSPWPRHCSATPRSCCWTSGERPGPGRNPLAAYAGPDAAA